MAGSFGGGGSTARRDQVYCLGDFSFLLFTISGILGVVLGDGVLVPEFDEEETLAKSEPKSESESCLLPSRMRTLLMMALCKVLKYRWLMNLSRS